MFTALAVFVYARRWWTLAASALFLAVSIALLLHGGRLRGASFSAGEAEQTQRLVEQVLGHSADTTFVAVFHRDRWDPGERPFRDAMNAALAAAGAPCRRALGRDAR
jgi:hypothetical protein